MPVIGIPVNNLLKQLDLDISRDDLITNLEQLGCDVEGYTTLKRLKCSFCEYILELTDTEPVPGRCPNCDNQIDDRVKFSELADLEVIKMELLAVRPDMFDVGGLSRALRGYLGYDKGIAEYRVSDYSQKVTVDPSVNTSECSRPAIACAVIKNINLDSDLIKSVMKLQDNLHWAMGRNRKHASIGIYDLDKVKGPFNYTSTPREGIKFVPLNGMPNDNYNEVFPQEILDAHPKGIGYAHLLDGFTRVPLLMDSDGKVMSMPPVINSDSTKVTVDTKAFFIDVTGTGDRIVNKVLNILVSSFAELFKNCRIEKVLIKQAKCVNTDRDSKTTPDFTVQKVVFNSEEASNLIGVDLTYDQVRESLLKMRHGVNDLVDEKGGRVFEVLVPAYRNDILHPRDLIEDVAIAYGYHNIVTSLVPTMTVGSALPESRVCSDVRADMIGKGFLEVMSLMLTSPEKHFDNMFMPVSSETVLIHNPASSEQSIVRPSILPGLIEILSTNTHNPLPQNIFELGDVTLYNPGCETGAEERKHLACASAGPKSGFAFIRPVLSSLLRHLGIDFDLRASGFPYLIPGRSANIYFIGSDIPIGTIGEVHPQVLEKFKIIHPVSVFELNMEPIIRHINSRGNMF